MSVLPGKREFLSQNINPTTGEPFAKFPSRGRLSVEAHAFADANRDKWSEDAPVVKAPAAKPAADKPVVNRTPAPARVKAPAVGSYDPNEVRAWAKQNGHVVGDRGRIATSVIEAFRKVDGGTTVKPAKPVAVVIPNTRSQRTAWVVEGNTVIALTRCADTTKGGCGLPVNKCRHDAPIAPHYLNAGVAGKPMSLTKPVV